MKTPPLFSANGTVGCGARATPEFATCTDLLRHMDRLGIRRSLVWSTQARDHHPAQGNRQLLTELDALDPRRERLVPSFVIAPAMLYEADSVAELTQALRSGQVRALRIFPGTLRHKLRHLEPLLKPLLRYKPVLFVDIRDGTEYEDLRTFAETFPRNPILCGYWGIPVTDPRFEPAYRYANRHRLPILFHTWDGPYDQPGLLKDIVKRHPQAIFVLGHAGGGDGGRRDAEELARAHRNVYLEWCGSFCSRIPWEETLARVGERQVVFGTDGLFHDFA